MTEVTQEDLDNLGTEELLDVLESLEGIDAILEVVEDEMKTKEKINDEQIEQKNNRQDKQNK